MNVRRLGMVLALLVAVTSAKAQSGLGLGVIVGEPTGLSMKLWLTHDQAVDAAIAWSFNENDSVQFHADYLFHNFNIVNAPSGRVPLYYGLGARVKLKGDNDGRGRNDSDALVGIRIPFGVSYLFADAPLDLFAEIVPILDVAPESDFDLNLAVGMRFYFR